MVYYVPLFSITVLHENLQLNKYVITSLHICMYTYRKSTVKLNFYRILYFFDVYFFWFVQVSLSIKQQQKK